MTSSIKLLLATAAALASSAADWPSYNRTLESGRFAPEARINRETVGRLQEQCRFDTGLTTSFQTGLIQVADAIYFSTDKATFSIDPASCALNWRSDMSYQGIGVLNVNRGVAFLDGRLFRGTQDGRLIALDAATGKQIWERQIGIKAKGETTPAAPIAWDGLVFIGVAGGDNYDVQGRMYALDARTGAVRWVFQMVPANNSNSAARGTWANAPDVPISGGGTWTSYTLDPAAGILFVPGGNPAPDFAATLRPGANLFTNSIVALDARTGALRHDYDLHPDDYHDWDASAAPALIRTRAGRDLVVAAVKDGHLYGFDRATGKRLYATPVTTMFNTSAPLTASGTRFCPGTQGGNEWNGPGYSPQTNLIYTGSVDWCSTVSIAPDAKVRTASIGQPWSGSGEPKQVFGAMDPPARWAGWVHATNADTGRIAWRHKTPFPILAGVTPTAGGLLFAGDMGGNLYGFNSANGKLLFRATTGGALGGGIITYDARGAQRLAVASGMTSPIWPTAKSTAKVIVYSLANPANAGR
jgi:alcohol dehydrogenase (cytochrome c)